MAKVPNEVAKKFKALEKLVSLGISSEDEIKKLTPKDLMDGAVARKCDSPFSH